MGDYLGAQLVAEGKRREQLVEEREYAKYEYVVKNYILSYGDFNINNPLIANRITDLINEFSILPWESKIENNSKALEYALNEYYGYGRHRWGARRDPGDKRGKYSAEEEQAFINLPDGALLFKHFVLRDLIYEHNIKVFNGRNTYYRILAREAYNKKRNSFIYSSIFTLGIYGLFNTIEPRKKFDDDWVAPQLALLYLENFDFYKIELFNEYFHHILIRENNYNGYLESQLFVN